ncbi:MAG: phosphoserine phosphatase SerB [Azospirillaceae bacterium]
MKLVLTIVAATEGGLTAGMVERLRAALTSPVLTPGPADWLAPGRAADLPLEAAEAVKGNVVPQSLARQVDGLAERLGLGPVDLALLPAAGRRKRLLLADMDSTIVTAETLDEMAGRLGLKDEIAAITARAMAGELDFESALRKRVGMLKGLPESAIAETLGEIVLSPGAETLVRTMAAHGAHTILVSGGFTDFTEAVAARAGFREHRANVLERADGRLTGQVREPILGREAKDRTLRDAADRLGLALSETLAVGDGANDAEMIRHAGLGVGYRPKPLLRQVADACILHGDLTTLLYFQGFRRADFAD